VRSIDIEPIGCEAAAKLVPARFSGPLARCSKRLSLLCNVAGRSGVASLRRGSPAAQPSAP